MDDPTPPPPPAAQPPENPPETAASGSHNCTEKTNLPMANFRALMMKLTLASSPSKSLTPAQTLIFEEKIRQCFPYLKAPDHPPYSWMITSAIKQLKQEGGCSEEEISECIMNHNSNLPWAHATLLRHHLGKLCEKGDIVQAPDGSYMLNETTNNVSHISSPSNLPSDSPSFNLSDGISSDSSSSDSTVSFTKRKRRKRKPKKVETKRRRKQKNIHLKGKTKVLGRRPRKRGKRKKAKSSSDEETEAELHDMLVEVEVEEDSHPSEYVKQDDDGQPEMQETTNSSPCEEESMHDVVIIEEMDVDVGQNPITTEAENLVVEARINVIEARDEQKEEETMEGRNPLGPEPNDTQLPADRQNDALEETKEAERQDLEVEERTVVIEEHNQSKQPEEGVENQLQEALQGEDQLEVSLKEVEEDINGNPAKKEERDWACETDVLLQERSDVNEEQHEPMQRDVMEEEVTETKDEAEETNLVNDTEPPEKVDEEQQLKKEHGGKRGVSREIVLSLKSTETKAKTVEDQSPRNIKVAQNTDEPGARRCLRSRTKTKAGQRQEAVQTSEMSEHKETVETKQNACEEHSHVKVDLGSSSDEVEETTSPLKHTDTVASEEEQPKHNRPLRQCRVPKTEPGTQKSPNSQGELSPIETRRVTRKMAAASTSRVSPLPDEQTPQQKKKASKSQAGEVSSTPRRSARLSVGQSRKKKVSSRRT